MEVAACVVTFGGLSYRQNLPGFLHFGCLLFSWLPTVDAQMNGLLQLGSYVIWSYNPKYPTSLGSQLGVIIVRLYSLQGTRVAFADYLLREDRSRSALSRCQRQAPWLSYFLQLRFQSPPHDAARSTNNSALG